ncbi:MAG TPA: prepilin-type N-terminal cleavage/methylation domain-containing protein [Polyangiaceae bacterium]
MPERAVPRCSFRSVRRTRAFTLVELLVVVAIVGVLSTIGITLFRQHVSSGRSIEATSMIQSIAAAQERWRAESQRYLDVSASLTAYYPETTPNRTMHAWESITHADKDNWRRLNVTNPGAVQAVYTTVAGNAGTDPNQATNGFTALTLPTFGTQNEPWYLIHAKADLDGDSTFSLYLAGSLNGEVYVKNQGE